MDIVWFIKLVLTVVMTFSLSVYAWQKRELWIYSYTNLRIKLFILAAPVILITLFVAMTLFNLFPHVMSLSIFSLFGQKGVNIVMIGTDIPYFGILFLFILIMALPYLAFIEEKMFRLGTKNWKDGINRSILFGLMHLTSGVPLGAGIALIIPGLFFTWMYFRGGIFLSWRAHLHYNLMIVSYVLYVIVVNTF